MHKINSYITSITQVLVIYFDRIQYYWENKVYFSLEMSVLGNSNSLVLIYRGIWFFIYNNDRQYNNQTIKGKKYKQWSTNHYT